MVYSQPGSYRLIIAIAAGLAVLCGFGAAKVKNKVCQVVLIAVTALLVAFVFFQMALIYA